MYFGNQKFLVAGLSRSGEAAADFLLRRGAEVYVYDDVVGGKVAETVQALTAKGATYVSADALKEASDICDVLVLSPGIPIDSALPVSFRKSGKSIVGEEELAALYLRATAIAVTGTNGKTTTVSMLSELLTACGKKNTPCGNFGTPTLSVVENLSFDDFAVIEVSSFQLETLFSLRPHIAVVTNITEDHLNRHYNMDNYVYLKSKLVRVLRESEFAVLNYDDVRVRAFAKCTKAKVVWFSAVEKVEGAYAENGYVYYFGERVYETGKMKLSGLHNLYNALACVAVSGILGLDKEKSAKALCDFKGVKHRIELIGEYNGISYVDDSKGTNVDATIKAVETLDRPTVILLGGRDKGYDYAPLFEMLSSSRVRHAVLYGENRFHLMEAAVRENFTAFSLCPDFTTAVRLARLIARSGQCVLLSPASSSFDEFSSYEERGDAFAEIAEGFADEKTS